MKSFQRSGEGQILRKSTTSRKEIPSCQDCKHLVSAANQGGEAAVTSEAGGVVWCGELALELQI